VHPDGDDVEEPDVARLVALADHPKVVAIGETGLDYYWQKGAPRMAAGTLSHAHSRRARLRQALIIHTRAAAADTLR